MRSPSAALACALAALAPAALAAPPAPPPCSLNGVVGPGGACACDAGWSGADCHVLNLKPAAPLAAASQPYFHPANGGAAGGGWTDNSWGISVAQDDADPSLWHAFMTELEGNCSLSSYGAASRIVHATARSPAGPFAVDGVALAAFAHNPQVIRARDGAWLLFHIGREEPAGCAFSCAPGAKNNASCTGGTHATGVARATSPYGPWERVPFILPTNETNPSALALPDGSLLVTARRWVAGAPTFVARDWRGPYVANAVVPVVVVGGAPPGAAPFDEDPCEGRGGRARAGARRGASASPPAPSPPRPPRRPLH